MHRVFLVPGFFGFAHVAGIRYFRHVRLGLEARLPADRFAVSAIRTRPTGSLKQRALALYDALAAGSDPGDTLHLIGHSTGGIDARLLVTPRVKLADGLDVDPVAARVGSVLSLASPHRGSPMATVFGTLQGKRFLRLFALVVATGVRGGRVPLGLWARLRDVVLGATPSGPSWEELRQQMLGDLDPEPRQAIEAFLAEVNEDRSLVGQLTPDAMDVFDATTPDRDGVRYGSVCLVGRPPGLRSFVGAGIRPHNQAAHAVYVALHRLAGPLEASHAPPVDAAGEQMLRAAKGGPVTLDDNDGFVPTRSQVHGEVVHATMADHLDVIGHFFGPDHDPPHTDWLPTGSGFRRPQFDALLDDVAAWMACDVA